MKIKLYKQKGFTLVELLLVIAIIGILSTVAVVNLNVARAKARDARRMSDMEQIVLALNVYKETNGHYPYNSPNNPPANINCASWDEDDDGNFIQPLVTEGIFTSVPGDPLSDSISCNGGYGYKYYRYDPVTDDATDPCEDALGPFFVLMIINMETSGYVSPGWSCPPGGGELGYTWTGGDWITGGFEN